MLNVMVSQTWSWFHAQLDFPKSKRIKVHILRPKETRSYCGLQNNDDVGEMTWEQFVGLGEDACSKCRRQAERQSRLVAGDGLSPIRKRCVTITLEM